MLHAHCPFSSGSIAQDIASSSRVPLIATFHSKYRSDFERIIPNRYVVKQLIRNIVSFYEQADEVWIPQASVEDTLREYGYKGKIEVVDNGNDFADTPYSVKLKEEAKKSLGLEQNIPLLLFVGQHIWEKNTKFLLHALALMHEVPFRMIFIGTGYAAKEMKQLADKLGLTVPSGLNRTPKVSFAGPINSREVLKQYYLASDLFLFPSLYDNAPLVVREAAALHTPSILLKDSTAAEIISDGVNGFLSRANENVFADKITRLLGQPFLIEKAGSCAAQSLARSWKDIADEVDDRYNHLIKRYNAN